MAGGEGFGPGRSRHQRRRRGGARGGWETPKWKCGESVGWTMIFTMIYDIYGDIEWWFMIFMEILNGASLIEVLKGHGMKFVDFILI